MGEEVKVFGTWGSPYSHRVKLALQLKGKSLLHHDGKPISESLLIIEYLDETWKINPILPEDPYEKAMARFWANCIDDKCWPAIRRKDRCPKNEREKLMEEACECLKTLESALNGKKFFGGDTVGLADTATNIIAYWLRILQEAAGCESLSAEKLPDLFKWTDGFVNCSVVKESLPPRDKLLPTYRARFAATTEAQN
ncbi:Tau class glutathione transferase GSTU45 [Hibiscus syriacus]|uniref:glutathione transferase n=1 Tax=Hibiscus syriacus TaxID=106335 RepID=A0A6A2ZL19_HIBSY|nr:Tau class glutathione transferase GSTU45 [Hibiscus syriacus]